MSENTGFKVPEGAKPWTPLVDIDDVGAEAEPSVRDDVEDVSITDQKMDPSRVIPGLAAGAATAQVELDAPIQSEEQIAIEAGDADDDEESVERKICTACGAPFGLTSCEIDISEEDKTRWLRHVLGEARFTQTYPVFDGRMLVTFRSRTTEENDMIFKQLTYEINNSLLPEAPYFASPAYVARLNRLMLIMSISQVRKLSPDATSEPDQVTDYPCVDAASYPIKDTDYVTPVGKAHQELLEKLDEGIVSIFMTLLRRFDALTSTLVNKSSDPDFWKPADAER